MKRICFSIFLSLVFLQACNLFKPKSCEDEELANVCVTGKYNEDSSISFVRERENVMIDTPYVRSISEDSTWICFSEAYQKQRVLVIKNEIVIDSSDWFRQEQTDDECHFLPKTIVFD